MTGDGKFEDVSLCLCYTNGREMCNGLCSCQVAVFHLYNVWWILLSSLEVHEKRNQEIGLYYFELIVLLVRPFLLEK